MQRIDGRLVLSPTDLTKHLACAHVTTLDVAAADGLIDKPEQEDEALELVFRLGLAHETSYLDALRAKNLRIVELPTDFADRAAGERATVEAMESGADVIYQGMFFDGAWGGQADFLLRAERPSRLGSWSYDIADTKLARRLKVPALLQMAMYAERLTVLQGVPPEQVSVVTGDGAEHPWRLVDVAAYAWRARARLDEVVRVRPPTEPVPVAYCAQCRWSERCAAVWQRDDDLSLVAFMRADHREALRAHGIRTLTDLGTAAPDDLPATMSRSVRVRLTEQAAEQLRERRTGSPSYVLLPPLTGIGLLRLPSPSPGDLYLDFEGDPYAEDGAGREYLAGIGDRHGGFTALWAHDRAEERQLTIDLVDHLVAAWRADPSMHVYHYAPYEVSALKRLTARYGVREAELDMLLRAERFVDLYAVVRQGLRISKPSYSIKKLEAFYWSAERGKGAGAGSNVDSNAEVSDAMASVVAYEKWLVTPDSETLPKIEAYNRDDVQSTHALHEWLEERRAELESLHGPQERPDQVSAVPDEPLAAIEVAELDLAARLHDAGHGLLADLVQWHRREARPGWWEFFRIGELDDDELVNDASALGPLSPPVLVGSEKQSRLWKYTFAPQDTRVKVGTPAVDDRDHESAGTVVELDPVEGFVIVKRKAEPKLSRAFGPPGPIRDPELRRSIAAAGESALSGEVTLAGALVDRRVPPDIEVRPGETAADAVVRIGRCLDGTVLAVQGPPGSGKSTVAARLIRELLDAGKTVGVTATSHAVIGNLLSKVDRPAIQKCTPEQHCGSDQVRAVATNADVVAALRDSDVTLIGGTAWLWAREDMAGSVDVLIVDEAGQFSLANAVAVARGARSMVLLGDPQQLAQPSQAVHPEGAGVSALEHLLDGHDTIPSHRGVFLDVSWRMHPAITEVVSELAYDSRLAADPSCATQMVGPGGAVEGSGIRIVWADHLGRAAKSPEEARVVAEVWRSLQGVSTVDKCGVSRSLGVEDMLVVAPYNNQVGEIRALLPPGARVGTVDKFQGQEAPVVVYSMTSSSAADAPRGIDFLYDLHRLNVAISRAQALAVVVMSPALLDAAVHTPEQLRRVNALCRLAERANAQRSGA